jgi:hypothetical protein
MFRQFLLLTILFTPLLSLTQTVWETDFGLPDSTFAIDIQQTNDGNFLLYGGTYVNSPEPEAFLLKFTEDGDSLWLNLLGFHPGFGDDPKINSDLVITQNDDIMVGGSSLRRYDQSGDLIWSAEEECLDITEKSNGEILAISTRVLHTYSAIGDLISSDTIGNTINDFYANLNQGVEIGDIPDTFRVFTQVDELASGNIVLGGVLSYPDPIFEWVFGLNTVILDSIGSHLKQYSNMTTSASAYYLGPLYQSDLQEFNDGSFVYFAEQAFYFGYVHANENELLTIQYTDEYTVSDAGLFTGKPKFHKNQDDEILAVYDYYTVQPDFDTISNQILISEFTLNNEFTEPEFIDIGQTGPTDNCHAFHQDLDSEALFLAGTKDYSLDLDFSGPYSIFGPFYVARVNEPHTCGSAQLVANTSYCTGENLIAQNLGIDGSNTWTLEGYGSFEQAQAPEITFDSAEDFWLHLQVEDSICMSSSLDSVLLTVTETPMASTINQIGNTLSVSTDFTVQWYLDGSMIFGANDTTYLITEDGDYQVEFYNGSCSSLSDVFPALVSAVTDLVKEGQVTLTRQGELVELRWREELDISSIQLMDIGGRLIEEESTTGQLSTQFDLSTNSEGIYILLFNGKKELIGRSKIIK